VVFCIALKGRCRNSAPLFNNNEVKSAFCAGLCPFRPVFCAKKNADRTMWGTQACPRKEGVRNSRCMCDAGKVEPHGWIKMHCTIPPANKVLFPPKIPARICPTGETPRKFMPTRGLRFCRAEAAQTVTVSLHFPAAGLISAPATSRAITPVRRLFLRICHGLTDLFTLP
jgi:hypothetical protein